MSADPRNIREDIKRYVPGIGAENSDHGCERINILLLGFAGHGKSSLINSCMCVVKDEIYRNLAGAGKNEGGTTTKRTSHKLTNTIWITDNRGFKTMNPEEILEVSAQLRHLRQMGDVAWLKDNLEETLRRIPESYRQPKDFIFPVIVHSCLYKFKEDEENSMRTLIKKCQEVTKIPPVVLITNVKPLNTRSGNCAAIEKQFGEMGCTHRIRLENYTENSQNRSPEADNQFLYFLDVCMNEAEHAIQQRGSQDPHKIFAEHVADQVKEEYKVKESERKRMQRELKEEQNKVRRELEEERNKVRRELETGNQVKRELEAERKNVRRLEESLQKEKANGLYSKCSIL